MEVTSVPVTLHPTVVEQVLLKHDRDVPLVLQTELQLLTVEDSVHEDASVVVAVAVVVGSLVV